MEARCEAKRKETIIKPRQNASLLPKCCFLHLVGEVVDDVLHEAKHAVAQAVGPTPRGAHVKLLEPLLALPGLLQAPLHMPPEEGRTSAVLGI